MSEEKVSILRCWERKVKDSFAYIYHAVVVKRNIEFDKPLGKPILMTLYYY